MNEHVIETITPSSTTGPASLLTDCSCGAEILSADDADAVERAFLSHVPGTWVITRDTRYPHNLTGSRLIPQREGNS